MFNKDIVGDVTATAGQYVSLYLQIKEHQIVISHVCKGVFEIVGFEIISPLEEEERSNYGHPADYEYIRQDKSVYPKYSSPVLSQSNVSSRY